MFAFLSAIVETVITFAFVYAYIVLVCSWRIEWSSILLVYSNLIVECWILSYFFFFTSFVVGWLVVFSLCSCFLSIYWSGRETASDLHSACVCKEFHSSYHFLFAYVFSIFIFLVFSQFELVDSDACELHCIIMSNIWCSNNIPLFVCTQT